MDWLMDFHLLVLWEKKSNLQPISSNSSTHPIHSTLLTSPQYCLLPVKYAIQWPVIHLTCSSRWIPASHHKLWQWLGKGTVASYTNSGITLWFCSGYFAHNTLVVRVLPLHTQARPALSVSKILEVIYALNAFISLAPCKYKKLSTPKCFRKAPDNAEPKKGFLQPYPRKAELHFWYIDIFLILM